MQPNSITTLELIAKVRQLEQVVRQAKHPAADTLRIAAERLEHLHKERRLLDQRIQEQRAKLTEFKRLQARLA